MTIRMGFMVSVTFANSPKAVCVMETVNGAIVFSDTVYNGTWMTPDEARALARSLYRLARRIEKRQAPPAEPKGTDQ